MRLNRKWLEQHIGYNKVPESQIVIQSIMHDQGGVKQAVNPLWLVISLHMQNN